MLIRDKNVDPLATILERTFIVRKDAIGASFAATVAKLLPGVAFTIKRVTAWGLTASAGVRVDVQIGAVTALTATLAPGVGAAAPAVAVLAAAVNGLATDALSVILSSAAAEAATEITVAITIRYRVARGDPGI